MDSLFCRSMIKHIHIAALLGLENTQTQRRTSAMCCPLDSLETLSWTQLWEPWPSQQVKMSIELTSGRKNYPQDCLPSSCLYSFSTLCVMHKVTLWTHSICVNCLILSDHCPLVSVFQTFLPCSSPSLPVTSCCTWQFLVSHNPWVTLIRPNLAYDQENIYMLDVFDLCQ